MMKRFEKGGKWIGLVLVALGLLFAGCAGPSSEEGTTPSQSGQGTFGIPVEMNNGNLIIGDGAGNAVANINGHTVEVQNGTTACVNVGDVSTCWIRLINRDTDEYMANVFLRASYCTTCTTAVFDNADAINGNTILAAPGNDGNVGGSSPINGGEYCVVEDGVYSQASPYNAFGCPSHDNPVSSRKPYQVIHPTCGAKSVLWDFGGELPQYRFYVSVKSQYFPWNPVGADGAPGGGDDDPRYEFNDHTTVYVMVNDFSDIKLAGAKRAWYRLGSYVRSQVLSGYSAIGDGRPVMAPRQYFSVNVAIEYPDRLETYITGDKSAFTNYEYYVQFAYVFRYNPLVVQSIIVNGKTSKGTAFISNGANDICTNTTACALGKDTFRGYVDPGGSQTGFGAGYILTYEPILQQDFSYLSPGNYSWANGAVATINSSSQVPGMMAQKGRAHLKIGAITYASTGVIQEGPDAAPDMPMAQYIFKVLPAAASGSGSEFWVDQYASFTGFIYGWTNGTLKPSGFFGSTDDWMGYCWPMQPVAPALQGCDGALPLSSYIISAANEMSNTNISHSGFSVPLLGAYQNWSAYICVQ